MEDLHPICDQEEFDQYPKNVEIQNYTNINEQMNKLRNEMHEKVYELNWQLSEVINILRPTIEESSTTTLNKNKPASQCTFTTYNEDLVERIEQLEKRLSATESIQTLNEKLMRLKLSDKKESSLVEEHRYHEMITRFAKNELFSVSIGKSQEKVADEIKNIEKRINELQTDMEIKLHNMSKCISLNDDIQKEYQSDQEQNDQHTEEIIQKMQNQFQNYANESQKRQESMMENQAILRTEMEMMRKKYENIQLKIEKYGVTLNMMSKSIICMKNKESRQHRLEAEQALNRQKKQTCDYPNQDGNFYSRRTKADEEILLEINHMCNQNPCLIIKNNE